MEHSSNSTVLEQRFTVFCLPRHALITIEHIPVQQHTVALGAHFCETLWRVGDRGSAMVKVLCYKSEGRWFDPS